MSAMSLLATQAGAQPPMPVARQSVAPAQPMPPVAQPQAATGQPTTVVGQPITGHQPTYISSDGTLASSCGGCGDCCDSTYNWSGFYVGANTGYAWGRTTLSGDGAGAFDDPSAPGIRTRPEDWLYGAQLGFDVQRGRLVFGLEGQGAYFPNNSETRIVGDDFAHTQYEWYATATARVGLAADRTLFYVKGGGAWIGVNSTGGDLDTGVIDPTDVTKGDRTVFGWTVGAGVERAIGQRLSAKLEYNFIRADSDNSGNIDGDTFGHDHDIHCVIFGLNYRFGGARRCCR